MKEWFHFHSQQDWTSQMNKDGLTVDYRYSPRGFNTMRASSVLPFKNTDVLKTLCAGYLR